MKITEVHDQINARLRKRAGERIRRAMQKEFDEMMADRIDDRVRKRKPRGSKMPALDAWIRDTLQAAPDATVIELWGRLRAEGRDELDTLYMDGERVVELVKKRERETGWDGFKKRVERIRNP